MAEIDGDLRNGFEHVVLYREEGNGYNHDYAWIDLKGCEVRRRIQVLSPKSSRQPRRADALSLMIRFQDAPMILEYANWAQGGDGGSMAIIALKDFKRGEVCRWESVDKR
jgi:hypothetical protein